MYGWSKTLLIGKKAIQNGQSRGQNQCKHERQKFLPQKGTEKGHCYNRQKRDKFEYQL